MGPKNLRSAVSRVFLLGIVTALGVDEARGGLEFTNQNIKKITVPTAPVAEPRESVVVQTQSAPIRENSRTLAEAQVNASGEDWKGQARTQSWSVGGMLGLGTASNYTGFAFMGTAAHVIASEGWLSDVNDRVYFEGQAGPLFTSGSSLLKYSLLLRWDFQKDDQWTLYAIGGLGGDISGSSLGKEFDLYPRFGIGALLDVGAPFLFRGELSHELIVFGINFLF